MVAIARRGAAVLAVAIAILTPALLFYAPLRPVAIWRESVFGTLTELLSPFVRVPATIPVRLVTIDDETTRRAGGWPWPNEKLADLIDRIQSDRPRAVLIDSTAQIAGQQQTMPVEAHFDQTVHGNPAVLNAGTAEPADTPKRTLPLLTVANGALVPTPAAADAMTAAHISSLRIVGSAKRPLWATVSPGMRALAPTSDQRGNWSWATTPNGSLRLLMPDARLGLETVSAWRILEGSRAANAALKSAVVLVRRVSDASEASPAWREAQGIAQLLNGMTPSRTDWALIAEAAAAALAGSIVSLLMVHGRARQALETAIGFILVFGVVSIIFFVIDLELIDPATPSLFILGSLVLSAILFTVRRSLGADAAAPPARRDADRDFVGVERREVTALVCEIRDLAALTETYRDSPIAMTRLVGKLLGTAAEIVRAHRGTIENIGPARLYAVFNAPGKDAKHAEKAAEAALAIMSRLDPLNEALEKTLAPTGIPFAPVNFSIGIDTGEAVVGDIGFKSKREFAAFGPALDGAAALAGLSKSYGPAILVGDKTEELINRHFALLELDIREVANANTPSFFALLGNPVLRANPRFKALQEGFRAFYAAYRKGNWEQAVQLLSQCAKLPGVSQRLISLYDQRIEFLKTWQSPRDWSGVLRLPIE
ncbi:MAG TPA: CHASE2 domain-containing protein [Alphaproteobacteria bacterium]|nr:CHASE2 domain-containing protein [Alphaproteobacteria bacterium]